MLVSSVRGAENSATIHRELNLSVARLSRRLEHAAVRVDAFGRMTIELCKGLE